MNLYYIVHTYGWFTYFPMRASLPNYSNGLTKFLISISAKWSNHLRCNQKTFRIKFTTNTLRYLPIPLQFWQRVSVWFIPFLLKLTINWINNTVFSHYLSFLRTILLLFMLKLLPFGKSIITIHIYVPPCWHFVLSQKLCFAFILIFSSEYDRKPKMLKLF